jgi:hypothetical protein
MADYHPLIARAVEGLGASTGEARRALYERARAALVAQLRGIEPPLSEADITRERLALEDAIRKVEAEAVRKARGEPRPMAPPLRPNPLGARPQPSPPSAAPPPRPEPPPQRDRPSTMPASGPPRGVPPAPPRPETPRQESLRGPPEPSPPRVPAQTGQAPQPGAQPSARDRILSARTSPISREGLKGLRDVVSDVDDLGAASAKSAQSARDTRDSYGTASQHRFSLDDDERAARSRIDPHFDDDESDLRDADEPELDDLEPSVEEGDDEPAPPFARQRGPRGRDAEEEYDEPRPPRSYRGIAKLAVVLIILAGIAATVSWQWSSITGLYDFVMHMRSHPSQTAQTPSTIQKSGDRVPQQQAAGQAPGAAAPGQQAGPEVAQRVVLYEEDPNDPQGKRFVGSAVWRTDTVSPGSGLAPELEVRADITIPDRNMTVTWTLRRNTDQALPASHTIEIMFNVAPDFPGGGVANVPGVLMKDSEQARGIPLAGLAVKVTNGFFLIGLSAVDTDVQRNLQLLKDKPWFDIPVVYNNGGRAILAMEKGPPGDRAFADAFAAWSK